MPINRKEKIILIHIPKNAGSSIAKTLNIYPENRHKKNLNICYGIEDDKTVLQSLPLEYYDRYLNDILINECLKIAVVRNPYDRVLSDYFWSDRGCKNILEFLILIENTLKKEKSEIIKYNDFHQNHFLPQYEYIRSDKFKIDKIFRFENINQEFQDFFPEKKLCHINQTNHVNWKEFFADKRKELDLINKIYSVDFKKFNYKKL